MQEADGRCDRAMVGGRGQNADTVDIHHALRVLVHLDGRRFGEVGVMGDAVADVVAERRQRRVDDLGGARWADDLQRCGFQG